MTDSIVHRRSPFWWVRWVPAALLAAAVALLIVVLGRSVLVPLLVSFALCFMLEPLVERYEARGWSRNVAVLLALTTATVLLVLFLLFLVPSVWFQLQESIDKVPAALQAASARLHDLTDYVEQRFGPQALESVRAVLNGIRDDPTAITSRVGAWLYSGVFGLVNAGTALLGLLIVPFFVYYILVDMNRIRAGIDRRIPERFRGTGVKLFDEIGDVVRGYVRGRFLVAVGMSVVYAAGLWLVGVPLWAGIGIIAGFVGIVPYLGVLCGLVLALAFAVLDGGGVARLGGVALVFGFAQLVEDYVLTPRLIGDRLELHPMLVFIGLIIAGDLFGLLGLVLAIPALAVIKVLFRFLDELYVRSDFYHGEDLLEPGETAARVRGAVEATTAEPAAPAAPAKGGSLRQRLGRKAKRA